MLNDGLHVHVPSDKLTDRNQRVQVVRLRALMKTQLKNLSSSSSWVSPQHAYMLHFCTAARTKQSPVTLTALLPV